MIAKVVEISGSSSAVNSNNAAAILENTASCFIFITLLYTSAEKFL